MLAKLSRTSAQCTKYPLSIATHRFVLFGQVSKHCRNNGRRDTSWMESVQLRGSFSRECEKPKTYWLFAHPPLLEITLPEELLIKLQATYHLEWMACTWFRRLFPAQQIYSTRRWVKKKKSSSLLKTAAKRKRTYVSVLNALFWNIKSRSYCPLSRAHRQRNVRKTYIVVTCAIIPVTVYQPPSSTVPVPSMFLWHLFCIKLFQFFLPLVERCMLFGYISRLLALITARMIANKDWIS